MQQVPGALFAAAPILLGPVAVRSGGLQFGDGQEFQQQALAAFAKTVPLSAVETLVEVPQPLPQPSAGPLRERRERPQQRQRPAQPPQPQPLQALAQGPPLVPESEADVPNGLACARLGAEGIAVTWIMPAHRMTSRSHKTAVSPEFALELPGLGPRPFKLLAALPRFGGALELKCGAMLPPGAGKLRVSAAIGSDLCSEPMGAPVYHDFSDQSCCDLRGDGVERDAQSVLGRSAKRFVVYLEILPQPSA